MVAITGAVLLPLLFYSAFSNHNTEDCMHCNGDNYRGRISKTESGYKCQRWDSQEPHYHGFKPESFPEKHLEENYCRNPDGESRPWCFITERRKRWEFCSVPRCATQPPSLVPEKQCLAGNGDTYRGTVAVTVSGKECQRWDAQSPHRHNRKPENYFCKGLDNNFCRNPDGATGPWCYTTDPKTRWEYCKIPSCDSDLTRDIDCYENNGADYRGTASETISGTKCQAWSSMRPHMHEKTPQKFPDAGLTKNYCRNPDNDQKPWCYTMNPEMRWDYCNLRKCTRMLTSENSNQKPPPELPTIYEAPSISECINGRGEDYRGKMSKTLSGRTCQEWSSKTPHYQALSTLSLYTNAGLDENFCRNPDGDIKGPWCFTMDPDMQWEHCGVPKCGGNTSECGKPEVQAMNCFRRFSSCTSKPHSWPWQTSLQTSLNMHFCGGALIHPQWVLTAAQCYVRSATYKVVLGIHKKDGNEPLKQEFEVVKTFKGPHTSDIALLKLNRPALITDQVLPACLPPLNYMLSSRAECYVTGWGKAQEYLKQQISPVVANQLCNGPEFFDGRVSDNQLCAGSIFSGTDNCKEDEGGPLVCQDGDTFVLQGIASQILGCSQAMKPAIYIRVSRFIPWIEDIMRSN
nr:PREDICTED: plasminogen-like isoform X1 [Latimeria chalumnae]|eukprot:XP_014344832.1 PREDICTED: plasminogen-like isoform X1 [Latimeria chalumnae]